MNIYDPIANALGIEPRVDIKDYPSLLPEDYNNERLPCPVIWTEDMRKECGIRQKKLIAEGKHYFSKNTERNNEMVRNGTHPFLDKEAQSKRGSIGGKKGSPKASNLKRMAEGKHIQNSIVTCPHCGKEGNYMVMKRWHFDKCKSYSSPLS